MITQKMIFRLALYSDSEEIKRITEEDFTDILPFYSDFYRMGDYRQLTNGKTCSQPNIETSINFAAQEFIDLDIEYAGLEYISLWKEKINNVQLIRKRYNFNLHLSCELVMYEKYPALIFPLDFTKFLAENDIEFSIDLWE
ncbi:hypothetical protein GN157_01835 [Flavobacterium rakeshii]|uniref:DUF4279 domain-containing protein n=1 Tax=Flavobacterium rakeshii TaxID=1038845 RepID=A0A6N8HB86_9FLAO|nr:hypothetical protein [Flavobacterium rakeshii]MUV02436.1 hypothetical protein [Flavobacterium rakeshii]